MIALPHPLFLWLLRRTGRRKRFESVDGLKDAIAADRQRLDVDPPAALQRELAIERRERLGCPVWTLAPRGAHRGAVLLYLHGGAYIAQITPHHWHLVADLVRTSGCTAHVPLYPLAPEHDHRAAHRLVDALYAELSAASPGLPLVVMGDSAGAHLALCLVQRMVGSGQPAPQQTVLISPWLDLSCRIARRSGREADDPWLALPGIEAAGRWWAGQAEPGATSLSPLAGPLHGIGALTLYTGTRDLLHDECRQLCDCAHAAGAAVDLHVGEGMLHAWPLLPTPQGRAARRQLAQQLARQPLAPRGPEPTVSNEP